MAVEEKVEVEGEVVEALKNLNFRVKLDMGHEVLAHLAGKMRRFRIRVLPGDRVRVELSPYDLNRGRIVYRHKSTPAAPRPRPARAEGRGRHGRSRRSAPLPGAAERPHRTHRAASRRRAHAAARPTAPCPMPVM